MKVTRRPLYDIGHVTFRFAICHFLLVVICNRTSDSSTPEILGSKRIWVTTMTSLIHVTSSVT